MFFSDFLNLFIIKLLQSTYPKTNFHSSFYYRTLAILTFKLLCQIILKISINIKIGNGGKISEFTSSKCFSLIYSSS